jgi:uncharacterized protein YegJ (DUF2314 family)
MKLIKYTCLLISFQLVIFDSFAKEVEPIIYVRNVIYVDTEQTANQLIDESQVINDITIVKELPTEIMSIFSTRITSTDLTHDFPPPDLNLLKYFGKGLNKKQADKVQLYKAVIVVDFAFPLSLRSKGLKIAYEAAYDFAKKTDGFIWDSETRELFTPEVWKNKRIDAWAGQTPIINSQIVIHAYQAENGVRAITLGMAKFGLPDVVVENLAWSLNSSMSDLMILVAQSMVEGLLAEGSKLIVEIEKLKDSSYKTNLISTLKENATRNLSILFKPGEWEEGDPDNFLIQLMFNNFEGSSEKEKQEKLLSSIFGWKDDISYVEHNNKILEASTNAKKLLPNLKKKFISGFAPGEFLLLKAPFETPDGINEWMWVEVMSWKGEIIHGLLKNEPYNVPNLKAGTEVIVNQGDIFDYMHEFSDGTREGNKTGDLIRKYQSN